MYGTDHPELNPEIAKPRAAGHDWIHFYPIPNQKNIVIVHQIRGQRIKVIYHGQLSKYDEIAQKFADVVDLSLMVKPSGKSVTVSTEAPFIDLENSTFEQVAREIQQSIKSALAIKCYLF